MSDDTYTTAKSLTQLFEDVKEGSISPRHAIDQLMLLKGFQKTEHATTDTDRFYRRGIPEVIYGEGKSAAQIIEILSVLSSQQQCGLVTRLDEAKAQIIQRKFPDAVYQEAAQCLRLGAPIKSEHMLGKVCVVSAGTSDLGVAAETRFCLHAFGNEVEEVRDLGVSGLHRLTSMLPLFRSCQVIVAIAGFEAALPTVLSGLIDRPIIAVPTSVGYGVSFGGITALLGMLSSCAPGITVVNIDNGFGAAYAATLMNRKSLHAS
ncbi:MAG: nickel pincer cofactor biosynthesis protein LarB [Bradymonadia bacterium]